MLLSYRSDPALKSKYVDRAKKHREADEIVQGQGWDGKNGCCIGCLAHTYPAHEKLAHDIGIDEAIFHLADAIHEGLPGKDAKAWPERFANAIPVGKDASKVRWQFLAWLLSDEAVNPGVKHEVVREAVKRVADLCARAALGEMPPEEDWSAAESAAWSARSAARAARSARSARSAARAAWSARSAARAAWSADSAAESAESARSAAWSAESAAWSAAWKLMADKLVSLLKGA